MPHFYISATHKSSGKTTLSIGLAAAFNALGHQVQTFKKGPDYIDPAWLQLASNKPCINLDFYTNPSSENTQLFNHYMQNATMGIIEGNKGLFDGMDMQGKDCNASMAKLLNAPVILVLNTQGTIRGVAPLLLGYQQFDKDINIAGVILNRTGGTRHEEKLRNVIELYTDIKVIGAVSNASQTNMEERHLGLITAQDNKDAKQLVSQLKNTIIQNVDLKQIEKIAKSAPSIKTKTPLNYPSDNQYTGITIGILKSAAFGFYYSQDIQVFINAGVNIEYIDAEKDKSLPTINALFIGGGFPEVHLKELEENTLLRNDIKQAIINNLPCYAECGGLMYLTNKIHWQGKTAKMCGVIDAEIQMHNKPQGRGYIHLKPTSNHLWGVDNVPASIKAHEFHYSSLIHLNKDTRFAYEMERGTGIENSKDGIIINNCLANYAHLRDHQNNHWIHNFLNFVKQTNVTT